MAPKPERYQALSDPSPFTTRASEPLGGDATPPVDLTLIGIMSMEGKINVWVQPKEAEEPIQLVEGAPGPEGSGLKLVRVVSPNDMYKAVAEIEAGGQLLQVRFTEASLALAPGAGAPKPGGAPGQGGAAKTGGGPPVPGGPPQAGQPGQPGQGQNQGQQAQRPTTQPKTPPTVTPRRRIILPK
jgi:hypothetical protein